MTFDIANRIIRAGVEKATELQVAVNIAVVDTDGRLVAFSRMEDAEPVGALGASGKASLSSAFGTPSGNLKESADEPWARGLLEVLGTQVIVWSGAEPIVQNGRLKGAVGVAGAGPKDLEVARSAVGVAGLLGSA